MKKMTVGFTEEAEDLLRWYQEQLGLMYIEEALCHLMEVALKSVRDSKEEEEGE